MTIEYQVSIDDLIRFNLYHLAHSPFARRQKWMVRVVPAIEFLLMGLLAYSQCADIAPFIFAGAFALVWLAVVPMWWDWDVKRRTRKLMGEGQNRGM